VILLDAAHRRRRVRLYGRRQVFWTLIHHAGSPAAPVLALTVAVIGAAFGALPMPSSSFAKGLSPRRPAAVGRAVPVPAVIPRAQIEDPSARSTRAHHESQRLLHAAFAENWTAGANA
jgi:hypothetical protein